MAEYVVDNIILDKPAFAWWNKHVLNKRDEIISKTQQYWVKTHKYRIIVPKTVKESADIDKENGGTLWRNAIMQEMKNVIPAFEVWGKQKEDLPIGY